jgi:hypothetical protein
MATHSPLLPSASAALCVVFAVVLARQWWGRRRPYQLAWAIGMGWYGLASGADAFGQLVGWGEATYRTWYLAGALMAAAWLGLGEVYLLRATGLGEVAAAGVFLGSVPAVIRGGRLLAAGESVGMESALTLAAVGIGTSIALGLITWEWPSFSGHATAIALTVATVYVAAIVIMAPLDLEKMLDPQTGVPQGAAMPDAVRILSPIFNVGGALMLVFGAVHSARAYLVDRGNVERFASNVLIALGALTPSITGALNRWGLTSSFYTGEFLGVLFIFAGFLASREVISRRGGPVVASLLSMSPKARH